MCWCGIWRLPRFQRLSHTQLREYENNIWRGGTCEHSHFLKHEYAYTFLHAPENPHAHPTTHVRRCMRAKTTYQGQQKEDSQQATSHRLQRGTCIQKAPEYCCVSGWVWWKMKCSEITHHTSALRTLKYKINYKWANNNKNNNNVTSESLFYWCMQDYAVLLLLYLLILCVLETWALNNCSCYL